MRRYTTLALSSVSFAALVLAASPAFAQATESADCATIADEAQKQACLDQVDSNDPIAQAGDAATIPDEITPANEESGAIVITGSRIRRSEFNGPDPIQIINPELGLQEGKQETAELINSSPIAAGSTQITSVISTNFVTEGGEGAQTVSLRGLGAARTLILLNGRRAGPAGVSGSISSFDLNVIPLSVVRSVEILKTGASSIYGSDAIAGVVNIITKRDTDGLEIEGSARPTQHGGAETYRLGATWGKDFGRGHVLVSADYFRQNNLRRYQRPFLDCAEEYLTFTDGRRADLVNVATGEPACSGVLHNAFLTNNDFSFLFGLPELVAPNGQPLFVTQYQVGDELIRAGCVPLNSIGGIAAPENAYGCNFDGPSTAVLNQYSQAERMQDVFSGLTRRTLYADAAYEISPSVELFTELLYNNRRTKTNSVSQVSSWQFTGDSLLPSLTVNPATGGLSLNPAFPGAFCTTADFNCVIGDAGDPLNPDWAGNFLMRPLIIRPASSGTDIDYYRGVVGARGEFPALGTDFSWDIHGQYSRSDGNYSQDITLADSIFTQDFRTRSCEGLVTPVTGRPCIDIDFSDPRVLRGDFTPEEEAFLFGVDVGRTVFVQKSGEAAISGSLFNLPAGPLGIAAGAHLREDRIRDVPGEASQAANVYNRASAGITAGKTITREVFGEVEIPLIHNTPFIDRLALSAAGRITRVSADRADGVDDKFGDETWKLGADWRVNDWLRFRGSWGTSFRAPALFELFLENQTGFREIQDIDPCLNIDDRLGGANPPPQILVDNCAAAGIPGDFGGSTGGATIISGGGIGNLDPETSTAKVFGGVLTPRLGFLPDTRISLAIDYFDIEVRDEISQLGAVNILNGCYFSETFATEPLCDLITRLSSGAEQFNIDTVEDTYININSQRNRGIDFTGRIEHNFGNLGRLALLAQMTWQLEDEVTLFEGTSVDDNGEIGEPKWVGDFNLTWNKGPWTMVYGLDVIGSADDEADFRAAEGAALDEAGCRTSINRPGVPPEEAAQGGRVRFCPVVSVPAVDYHSISITREIGDRFALTLGMSNIFDKTPPRVSTVFNGGIRTFAQVPAFASQYDYIGRRFFLNVRASFGQ